MPRMAPAHTLTSKVETWPKSVRKSVDAIVAVFVMAYMVARERAQHCRSALVRTMAEEDAKDHTIRMQRLQIDLLQRRLENIPPAHRPHFAPDDRLALLQFKWLHGWSVEDIARQFVLHKNTIRRWLKVWEGKHDPGLFFGKPAWNKCADVVRWLIHEFRARCPESEIGTRTIAGQIEKAGLALSRATVQRVLRERKPSSPASAKKSCSAAVDDGESTVKPSHILRPDSINRTWHLDMTVLRLFWFKLNVVAVIDGYSRKLLTLQAFIHVPKTVDIVRLVGNTARTCGTPRFIVTDHGPQFRDKFDHRIRRLGITPVKGKVRSCTFNGKVERFFKTLKLWQRLTLAVSTAARVQARLNTFRTWYNCHRTHQGVSGRTPDEAWLGSQRAELRRILARNAVQPTIRFQRLNHDGDLNLPVIRIQILQPLNKSA